MNQIYVSDKTIKGYNLLIWDVIRLLGIEFFLLFIEGVRFEEQNLIKYLNLYKSNKGPHG